MERSGSAVIGASHDPDIARLFEHQGPFVTVYLPLEPELPDARHRIDLRWQALRRDLDRDAPADALHRIDDRIGKLPPDTEGVAIVATAEQLLLVEYLDAPPAQPVGRVGGLPSIIPVIDWRQSTIPHVVVLTDREGADITAFQQEHVVATSTPSGSDEKPITKSAPGGWSQKRYQQRAENTWESNASDVATEVIRLTDRVKARLVLIAGDDRAVELLVRALSRPQMPAMAGVQVEVIEGGRAAGTDLDALSDEVVRRASTIAAADTVAVLQKFREELGQHDRAANGPDATFAALAQGQVDVLLVHDDVDDDREAWFGPAATQVGLDEATVQAVGVDAARPDRLVDVAVRAALGTDASVKVVPEHGGPVGSIGAILRWSS